MTNPEVKTVNNNAQPSTLRRVATTLAPIHTSVYTIGDALANGKTLKEGLNEAKTNFKNVHAANTKQFKENVHDMAEQTREIGVWKYLFGLIPSGIEALDKAINE